MKAKAIISLFIPALLAVTSSKKNSAESRYQSIRINWVSDLTGDFSFRYKWSYPENIFRNEYGQLYCDVDCPERIDAMRDNKGRIYKDSLKTYYKTIDTTHQAHSIKCDAWCYEWAGTDYIEVIQNGDSIHCYTLNNAATHCSLHLELDKINCNPYIILTSIIAGRNAVYYCTNGYIKIDKKLWQQGIMKAEFSFNFEHAENPQKPIYWKGKIYTRIKKQNQL